MELNLFVPFFLGTAARGSQQLSRPPVSPVQAPACSEVGSQRSLRFPAWALPAAAGEPPAPQASGARIWGQGCRNAEIWSRGAQTRGEIITF